MEKMICLDWFREWELNVHTARDDVERESEMQGKEGINRAFIDPQPIPVMVVSIDGNKEKPGARTFSFLI
jgi:hypothetical protein